MHTTKHCIEMMEKDMKEKMEAWMKSPTEEKREKLQKAIVGLEMMEKYLEKIEDKEHEKDSHGAPSRTR